MIDRICQTIGQEKKRQKTTQKAAQEEEMHFYFSHISESQKRESSTGKKNFYG